MSVKCKCGEIFVLAWRNNECIREGSIEKCRICKPRKGGGSLG